MLSGFDVDLLTDIVYDFLGIGSGEVVAAVHIILFLFFVIHFNDGIAFRHEEDQKILASIDRNGWVTLIQLSCDIYAEQFLSLIVSAGYGEHAPERIILSVECRHVRCLGNGIEVVVAFDRRHIQSETLVCVSGVVFLDRE